MIKTCKIIPSPSPAKKPRQVFTGYKTRPAKLKKKYCAIAHLHIFISFVFLWFFCRKNRRKRGNQCPKPPPPPPRKRSLHGKGGEGECPGWTKQTGLHPFLTQTKPKDRTPTLRSRRQGSFMRVSAGFVSWFFNVFNIYLLIHILDYTYFVLLNCSKSLPRIHESLERTGNGEGGQCRPVAHKAGLGLVHMDELGQQYTRFPIVWPAKRGQHQGCPFCEGMKAMHSHAFACIWTFWWPEESRTRRHWLLFWPP